MQQNFSLTASPTGFSSENVTVDGFFEFNFDPQTEKLLNRRIVVTNMSPASISSGPQKRFIFSNQALDRSEVHQFEGPWPQGLGFRDKLHLVVTVFASFLDNQGRMVTQALDSVELLRFGNRYYEPVTAAPQVPPGAPPKPHVEITAASFA